MVFASRFVRVSTTWVSSDPQNGHFMRTPETAHRALHLFGDPRQARFVPRAIEHVGDEVRELLGFRA